MIVFTTRGWTGASVECAHASGTETYTVAGDIANPYDVAYAFADWIDDAARPWFGAVTATVVTVFDQGYGRVHFWVSHDPNITTTPTAAWSACFGDLGDDAHDARGTLAHDLAAVNWLPRDRTPGAITRAGSWRMGHQAFATRRPVVEDRFTALEVFILSEAQQYAAQPRTAYVYDTPSGTWRFVSVGAIEVADVDDDPTRFDVRIELVMEAP
jgi:hypothetical protein